MEGLEYDLVEGAEKDRVDGDDLKEEPPLLPPEGKAFDWIGLPNSRAAVPIAAGMDLILGDNLLNDSLKFCTDFGSLNFGENPKACVAMKLHKIILTILILINFFLVLSFVFNELLFTCALKRNC